MKEVVQNGSAWRSGIVKAGDIIVKVEQVNIQNQPLSSLRDLILGEPGTFVTLGFNRGTQYIEARMMRGTPEFLDTQHTSATPRFRAAAVATATTGGYGVDNDALAITGRFIKRI